MDSQRLKQRRRRVALEQTQLEEPVFDEVVEKNTTRKKSSATSRSYTPGARRSRQFRTTDLIPKRIWSFAAFVLLLLSVIAGLNLLHLNSPDWIEVIGQEGVAALSLDSGRGIGVWYTNFLLLLTSCVSLQLFLLRQHRRDDYRGSYRLWLWLAALFMLASAASVTGIASLAKNVLTNTFGTPTLGEGLTVVLVIKVVLLAMLVIRGLIEIRFSRLAIFSLLIVAAAYGTAAVINESPLIQVKAEQYIHSAFGNCLLIGCTALFVTTLSFARYVYLDASGLIKTKVAKVKKKASTEENSAARSETDTAATSTRSIRKKKKSKVVEASDSELDSIVTRKEQRRAARAAKAAENAVRKQEIAKEAAALAATQATENSAASSEEGTGSESAKTRNKWFGRRQSGAEVETETIVEEKQTRKQKRAANRKVVDSDSATPATKTGKRTKKKSVVTSTPVTPAAKPRSTKRVAATETRKVISKKAAVDRSGNVPAPENSNQTGKTRRAAANSKQQNGNHSVDDYLLSINDDDVDGLSKSERRRLRKLKRRAA